MLERDFINSVSFDLAWFTVKDAQKLLNVAMKAEYVQLDEGKLVPTFNIDEISIPLSFSPSGKVLEYKPPSEEDLFYKIVNEIAEKTDIKPKDIVSKINKKMDSIKLTPEVAALLIASRYDVPIEPHLKKVEKRFYAEIKTSED